MLTACGSSQPRDWAHATVTEATALTTLDPQPTIAQENSENLFVLATLEAYSSSETRKWSHATGVTWVNAVVMPDP